MWFQFNFQGLYGQLDLLDDAGPPLVLAAAAGESKRDFPMLGFWVSLGRRGLWWTPTVFEHSFLSLHLWSGEDSFGPN